MLPITRTLVYSATCQVCLCSLTTNPNDATSEDQVAQADNPADFRQAAMWLGWREVNGDARCPKHTDPALQPATRTVDAAPGPTRTIPLHQVPTR